MYINSLGYSFMNDVTHCDSGVQGQQTSDGVPDLCSVDA